jgi:hypothetical protein
MNYDKLMCQRSLDILNRVVFIGMQINHSDADLKEKISLINSAKTKLGL